ncbi:MAG TPA: hypothetical protein VHL80_17685 [Polyangia bacterium]|nr:hypothetical protein [Polyangia bacterium]
MSRGVLWGACFVLLAVASGAALLGIAMALYPGGTALDAHAPGHSFWLNFLCDLTSPVARNGVANGAGARAARAAMLTLSLGLGATWLVVPAFLPGAPGGRPSAARLIRGSGALCVSALVVVPLVPGSAHIVAIFTAAAAGLTAGVSTVVALARSHGPARRWLPLAAVLAATAADSIFYAQAVAARPLPPRPELPAVQRVGLLLALGWMVATALEILLAHRRAHRAERPGRS